MKSSKELVHWRTTVIPLIGEPQVSTGSARRTVYHYADGSWVSAFGNKRGRRAVPKGDGSYEVDERITELRATTPAELIGRIAAKVRGES